MSRAKSYLIVAVVGLFLFFGVYVPFLNHLEPNDRGLVWDAVSGEIYLQGHEGWNVSAPWVFVARLDTQPTKVCITSSARATFNCKLVQFVPGAYRQFVAVEGFRYYWWSNRFSFNWGYNDEYRGFRDVLRGYAFSGQKYPFIKVLADYQTQ